MKNFRLNLIFRIFLIVGNILYSVYLYSSGQPIAIIILLSVICLLQFILLFRYIDQTNRDISRFLLSIKYSDFSQTFTQYNRGKSFTELNNAFNTIIKKFHETRSEKEEQHQYLQTVLQHVGIGLISFDKLGNVELLNNAAKKLLKIQHLKNITSLNKIGKEIGDKIFSIEHNNKTTININDNNEILQILVYATKFRLRNKLFTLISLQNIQSELEENEMEAWQKLIRVLTHEIMNSITPITSLSGTIHSLLENRTQDQILKLSELDDISLAVNTIHKRSIGLIDFVNNYRNVTKIPTPNFKIVKIKTIFDTVEQLIIPQLKEDSILFTQRVTPSTIEITADPQLMEQVFLNLLLNAIHSVRQVENPQIVISAGLDDRGKTIVRVIDNGLGLTEDVAEKIFIPFFTTKKDGSGIGLSLSRQILRSHSGSIRVKSKPNVETEFTIRL